MNCVVRAWERHEDELRGFIRKQVNDASVAEDLLQDVFVKAVAAGSRFCELENARAWLFRVTRNRIADWSRTRKPQEPVPEGLAQPEPEDEPVTNLARCLPMALEALPPADREAIEQCDLEGLTQAEFARRKGLSLAGAKSRVQRARKRLKQALDEACRTRYDERGRVCCFESSCC